MKDVDNNVDHNKKSTTPTNSAINTLGNLPEIIPVIDIKSGNKSGNNEVQSEENEIEISMKEDELDSNAKDNLSNEIPQSDTVLKNEVGEISSEEELEGEGETVQLTEVPEIEPQTPAIQENNTGNKENERISEKEVSEDESSDEEYVRVRGEFNNYNY